MVKVIWWTAIISAAIFTGAGISTWGGNIILPAMGLQTPDYWQWMGFGFVVFIGGILRGILKKAIEVVARDDV